jgi:hypothetical protein
VKDPLLFADRTISAISVPHPFRLFLRKEWETANPSLITSAAKSGSPAIDGPYLYRVLHSTMLDFRAAICTRMAYTAINERRNIAMHAPD